MTVRVLRRADHLQRPWRIGGGFTAQVACSPDGDGSAPFDWRVSFAEVEHSGDFSAFPGVDRVIVLVEGPAMTLTVDGVRHVLQRHQPFAFDGESVTQCEVRAPTLDLNVMTRRGRVDADVEVLELDTGPRPIREADDLLVAVLAGEATVAQDGQVPRRCRRQALARCMSCAPVMSPPATTTAPWWSMAPAPLGVDARPSGPWLCPWSPSPGTRLVAQSAPRRTTRWSPVRRIPELRA